MQNGAVPRHSFVRMAALLCRATYFSASWVSSGCRKDDKNDKLDVLDVPYINFCIRIMTAETCQQVRGKRVCQDQNPWNCMGLLRSKCAMHINVLYVLYIFHENGKRHVTATFKTPKKTISSNCASQRKRTRCFDWRNDS